MDELTEPKECLTFMTDTLFKNAEKMDNKDYVGMMDAMKTLYEFVSSCQKNEKGGFMYEDRHARTIQFLENRLAESYAHIENLEREKQLLKKQNKKNRRKRVILESDSESDSESDCESESEPVSVPNEDKKIDCPLCGRKVNRNYLSKHQTKS